MTRTAQWLADHAAGVAAGSPPAVGTWWVLRDGQGWWIVGGVVAAGGVGGLVLHLWPSLAAFLRDWWASWRRERWYRRRWERAMQWSGMADAGAPVLVAHRFGGEHLQRDLDVLTVRIPAGQSRALWLTRRGQLCAALGLRRVVVHDVVDQPDVLQVFGSRFLQPATGRHLSLAANRDTSRAAGAS